MKKLAFILSVLLLIILPFYAWTYVEKWIMENRQWERIKDYQEYKRENPTIFELKIENQETSTAIYGDKMIWILIVKSHINYFLYFHNLG